MAQQTINLGTGNNTGDAEGLRDGGVKMNANFTELYQKKVGFFDYNDTATTGTPIVVTGGGGFVFLTNNELGAFTNKLYPPYGVTDVWDASLNQFDFNELSLGSKMHYRIDLSLTTTAANQEVNLSIDLAIGGSAYSLSVAQRQYKTAGAYPLVISSYVYMGDANTRDNPAKFKISSPNNATVVVNGWSCYLHIY